MEQKHYQPPFRRQRLAQQDSQSNQANTRLRRDNEEEEARPSLLANVTTRQEAIQVKSTSIEKLQDTRQPIRGNVKEKQESITWAGGGVALDRSKKHWPVPTSRQARNDSSQPASALESPASDLKPMRQRDMLGEQMEMVQSVSRSGGDGCEGDALKDYVLQAKYRLWLDEKIKRHDDKFGSLEQVDVKGGSKENVEEKESLDSIVLGFRKLREGVVASGRVDSFAVKVFETSARYAVVAQNRPQLLSILSGLVPGLYQAYSRAASGETDLSGQLDKLKIADYEQERVEFTSLLLVYHLVTGGQVAFNEIWSDLIHPRVGRLRTRLNPENAVVTTWATAPFVEPCHLGFAKRASQCLSEHAFNPLTFFSLIDPCSPIPSSSYERTVLTWAVPQVREKAWLVLKRGYVNTNLDWARQILGLERSLAEEWIKCDRAKVERDMVLLRESA
ncbi:uncharacterized protein L203_102333 [Cryptococcus depauperatus CBS 7841]|uniref:Uncharacterized protein n=1 Tax=Cryptococcus depauperatus CBS 7841 TaxID=1295531 RepID=A0AAJ8JRJ0_9TREE